MRFLFLCAAGLVASGSSAAAQDLPIAAAVSTALEYIMDGEEGVSELERLVLHDPNSLMRCTPGVDAVSDYCFLDEPTLALRIGDLEIRETKAQLWFESIGTRSGERTVGLTGLRADFDLRPGSGWVLAEIIVTRIP